MADFSDFRNRTLHAVALAIVGLACLSFQVTALAFIVVLAVVFAAEIGRGLARQPHDARGSAVTTAFFLVGLTGFCFASYLRQQEHGFYTLLLIALSVAATDTFAYVGGKRFGKTPFAPQTSPNKTVEGVLCGVVMGAIVFVLTWFVLKATHDTSLPVGGLIALAIFMPTLAVYGDLLESKSKRLLGLKDFGSALGEHGGVADRFDAMTTAFVVYGVVSILAA